MARKISKPTPRVPNDLTIEERQLLDNPQRLVAMEKLLKVRKLQLEVRRAKGELREATEVRNKMVAMYQVGRASVDAIPPRFRTKFGDGFTNKMRRYMVEQLLIMLEDMTEAGGE